MEGEPILGWKKKRKGEGRGANTGVLFAVGKEGFGLGGEKGTGVKKFRGQVWGKKAS